MNKGLVFDIKRFSVHDGPGIRTTVFLKGCPLNCLWCHNPESRLHEIETINTRNKLGEKEFDEAIPVGRWYSVHELMHEILKDRMFFEESGGGVTFSGGEPLMQFSFLAETSRQCQREGIHVTMDTCGYASAEALRKTIPYTDLFLFDLKGMNNTDHILHTGVKNETILQNLLLLAESQSDIIIRFPVIPGYNDSEKNITEMMHFLMNVPLHNRKIDLLPYHTIQKSKYDRMGLNYRMPDITPPGDHQLKAIGLRFESIGFTVKIGG